MTDKAGQPDAFEAPKGVQPTAPNVPTGFLLVQFWRDIFGKEVQSAATYSYLWMADQMGHVALGIILHFALTFVLQYIFGIVDTWASGIAFIGIAGAVSFWEYRAYTVSAQKAANNTFPLDQTLLKDNAVIAAGYMVFGVLGGYAFHLPGWWGAAVFLVALVLCVVCAPKWLRQKIVWQKAALPYLSRLADLKAEVADGPARQILDLVNDDPGSKPWRQIVIAGAIGAGRTPMVTGLGTDLAFRGYKARYLSFDDLVEVNEQFRQGHPFPPIGSWGPANIFYWPWFEAQVLLVDNVSPSVGVGMPSRSGGAVPQLGTELNQGLSLIREELCNRHTVWVFALDDPLNEDASQRLVDDYAANIRAFCKGEEEPIVVRLPAPDWMKTS